MFAKLPIDPLERIILYLVSHGLILVLDELWDVSPEDAECLKNLLLLGFEELILESNGQQFFCI